MFLIILTLALIVALDASCARRPKETYVPPPPTIAPPEIDPWKVAANKVEEDRGEVTGRKAEVEVPAELKHYSDRRRFLAVQVAEWLKQNYEIPRDYTDLVALIRRDHLVEIDPVGDFYIIYGVGGNATDEPFTHYDKKTGKDIELFASLEDYQKEDIRLGDSIKELQTKIADLNAEYKKTGRRDRARRRELQSQMAESRKALTEVEKNRNLLASFYKKEATRKLLLSEYQELSNFAQDFDGRSYDLQDPADRRKLKVRLLSFLRPEARDVMIEIARAYSEKFDRPLPITSLVRTERYQHLLNETNKNATLIDVPPHTTGLAFDIYDKYMTAEEQNALMAEISSLESAGRVEALRENRDHIHVFAFADGVRPSEELISKALGEVTGSKPAGKTTVKRAGKRKQSRGASAARSRNGKRSSKSTRASKAGGRRTGTEAKAGPGSDAN